MNMYFSLITAAEGRNSAAAHERLRADAYADHQWLWRFFRAVPGGSREFLFRRQDRADAPRYYVVSQSQPDGGNSAWSVQSREYAPILRPGEQLRFDLRANPVVTVTDGNQSRRHDVVMHAKKRLLQQRGLRAWAQWTESDKPALADLVRDTCSTWLDQRAERLGCEIDRDSLSVEAYVQHRGKGEKVQFSTVDLSGGLTVVEPARMLDALYRGVGHARAFGCGLLLVRRST